MEHQPAGIAAGALLFEQVQRGERCRDRLAAGGMVFTRAYCANPLCVPSRGALFTGRYPTETGIMDNDDRTRVRLDPKKFPMLGKVFHDAGYETAYYGKWHLAIPEKQVDVHGFEQYETPQEDPLTTSNVVKFLQKKHDKPFLMMASFLNPHNIAEWSRGQKLPLGEVGAPPPVDQLPPLRKNHQPPQDEPDIVDLMRRSYQAAPMFPVSTYDETKWREYIWAYYRLIEKVDREIGQVLDALKQSGQAKNTLVILSADHGDMQGSHRWNQKTILYEEATRVQFVMSYPGTIKAGTSPRLVNTGIDFMPTLCDYAGITPPPGLPGLSLKETANGKTTADPREFIVVSDRLVQGAEVEGKLPKPDGRMIRSQRYSYTTYSEGKRREALYDLEKDPGETVNLAAKPAMKSALLAHRAMLQEWCSKTKDNFPVPQA